MNGPIIRWLPDESREAIHAHQVSANSVRTELTQQRCPMTINELFGMKLAHEAKQKDVLEGQKTKENSLGNSSGRSRG